LLLFNGLGSLETSALSIPKPVAQLLTMSALVAALFLALTLNDRLLIRPSVVLTLTTILAATALMTTVRGTAGGGAVVRCVRLLVFVAVLWLLTPWWGRRDLLLARCHLRALTIVSGSVVLGALIFPSTAWRGNATGRLTGVLWSIPPPQVAEYAAVMAGMSLVLWLSGVMARRTAFLLAGIGIPMMLMSKTRTSVVAIIAGLACAGITLFLKQERVRRVVKVTLIFAPLAAIAFAPVISSWFLRNQSSEQIRGLTGRTQVWDRLIAAPRSEFNQWFGFGLSDKSFDGRPIDSTWLAIYQDEGLVGDILVAGTLLFLLVAVAFKPSGPHRALAMFLVVYCCVASYTEVGLGDASPYLLHVVVAASLVMAPAGRPWARFSGARPRAPDLASTGG